MNTPNPLGIGPEQMKDIVAFNKGEDVELSDELMESLDKLTDRYAAPEVSAMATQLGKVSISGKSSKTADDILRGKSRIRMKHN